MSASQFQTYSKYQTVYQQQQQQAQQIQSGHVDKTLQAIDELARRREDRRRYAEEAKRKREKEAEENEIKGRPGDVDFQRMINIYRETEMNPPMPHHRSYHSQQQQQQSSTSSANNNNNNNNSKNLSSDDLKINVVVRKRPINEAEKMRKDHDSVTCSNPVVVVHYCKFKVDGITKYLENTKFAFDHAFDEYESNEEVYRCTARPLVEFAFRGGRATCFAYGQTGSGKTFTMVALQRLAAKDVFDMVNSPEYTLLQLKVTCSFFELYGGRCIDLLNDHRVCAVREDSNGQVHVDGLQEIVVSSVDELLDVIARGAAERTTHATEVNQDSSRSHAICQISLHSSLLAPHQYLQQDGDDKFGANKLKRANSGIRKSISRKGSVYEDTSTSSGTSMSTLYGKLSLIDLAGSERGQDTKCHDKARRAESAEINKSLLALKECIRALETSERGGQNHHVPYRASKLTMVLKDSFSPDSRTVMISCVSPAASSSDHTLNTLRYADRVKEKSVLSIASMAATTSTTSVGNTVILNNNNNLKPSPSYTAPGTTSPYNGQYSKTQQSPLDQMSEPFGSNNNDRLRSRSMKVQQMNQDQTSSPAQIRSGGLSQRSDKAIGYKKEGSISPPPPPPRQAQEKPKQTKQIIEQPKNISVKTTSTAPPDLHEIVTKLVDEEEALIESHLIALQTNAEFLEEEGELLSRVQGGGVDYDIDEYSRELEKIIDQKLELFSKLKSQVSVFREHLLIEEMAVHRISAENTPSNDQEYFNGERNQIELEGMEEYMEEYDDEEEGDQYDGASD